MKIDRLLLFDKCHLLHVNKGWYVMMMLTLSIFRGEQEGETSTSAIVFGCQL